jgi:hypothetical protein
MGEHILCLVFGQADGSHLKPAQFLCLAGIIIWHEVYIDGANLTRFAVLDVQRA